MKIFPVIVLVPLLLSACVTINIYFPAAAAEKAADKIIGDIWQSEQASAEPMPETKNTEPASKEMK